MKIEVCGKLVDGEIVPVNAKGMKEIELDIFNDMTNISLDRNLRLVGIYKDGLYKMTLKSWKALKKYLYKNNQLYRYA